MCCTCLESNGIGIASVHLSHKRKAIYEEISNTTVEKDKINFVNKLFCYYYFSITVCFYHHSGYEPLRVKKTIIFKQETTVENREVKL